MYVCTYIVYTLTYPFSPILKSFKLNKIQFIKYFLSSIEWNKYQIVRLFNNQCFHLFVKIGILTGIFKCRSPQCFVSCQATQLSSLVLF